MLTIYKTNTENTNYIYLNSQLTVIDYSSQLTNLLHYRKSSHSNWSYFIFTFRTHFLNLNMNLSGKFHTCIKLLFNRHCAVNQHKIYSVLGEKKGMKLPKE